MRVLRAKSVRKFLKFYKLIFGIDAPYNIIVDGNFIFNAIKYKLDVRDRLEKLLQSGETKLYVLKSVVQELKLVGDKAVAAKEFAENYCELIDDERINGETPSERLVKFIESIHSDQKAGPKTKRYFVATQDQDLRRTLAQTPGVPLIYLNKVTLVLESPSQASLDFNKNVELQKTSLNAEETTMLGLLSSGKKRKTGSAEGEEEDGPAAKKSAATGTSSVTSALAPGAAIVSRKKHKARAPNPLSNVKASEDSKNSQKKKERKFRKFY